MKKSRLLSRRKYAKPFSLYPMKPEDALAVFMRANPERVKRALMRRKNGRNVGVKRCAL
jgi:hypothetical protein